MRVSPTQPSPHPQDFHSKFAIIKQMFAYSLCAGDIQSTLWNSYQISFFVLNEGLNVFLEEKEGIFALMSPFPFHIPTPIHFH